MLYANQQLRERVQALGVLDRHVRMAAGTLEAVISILAATSPEGIAHLAIVIDYVDDTKVARMSVPLAIYPAIHGMHAQEDGLILSRKWSLSLRRANNTTGWEYVRDVDAVETLPDGGPIILAGGSSGPRPQKPPPDFKV